MNRNSYLAACGTCDTSENYNPFKIMKILSQIVDFDTGLPVPNVNVYLKRNPQIGVITNSNGYFQLEALPDDIIVLSHVTYGEYPIRANDVQLIEYIQEKTNVLDTVVVTASKNKKWIGVALASLGLFWLVTRKEDEDKKPKNNIKPKTLKAKV